MKKSEPRQAGTSPCRMLPEIVLVLVLGPARIHLAGDPVPLFTSRISRTRIPPSGMSISTISPLISTK